MGFIVVGIAAALSAAASAVGAVVAGIAAAVATVAGAIVATVGGIVSAIATTIGTTLAAVINTVGGIVEGVSVTIKGALDFIRTSIAEPFGKVVESLKAGIGDIAKAITEPVRPILEPIKDTLVHIHDFMADTRAWIKTELKPVADLVGFVQDISALRVVKSLLEGTTDIAGIIGDVERESGAATAQAITVLYRDMVGIATDTLDILRGHYTRLTDTIDNIGGRLKDDLDTAIAYTQETIRGEVRELTEPLSERVRFAEMDIAGIERRTMDLPFFQQMLIRAVSKHGG